MNLIDAGNQLILAEHGLDMPMAERVTKQYAEKCAENVKLREALEECAKASYLDEYELEFKPTREALIAMAALAPVIRGQRA